MKSVDVICTPNESSKYEWRGTDGSSVECVKGNDDMVRSVFPNLFWSARPLVR
jgi:hypothetical protein